MEYIILFANYTMDKICTSLEQSKKLIELGLDVNTADMCYRYKWHNNNFILLPCIEKAKEPITGDIPAWSLSALMELMNRNCYNVSLNCHGAEWNVKFDDSEKYKDFTKDYAVDAAFEMVCWLLENKML